MSKLDNPDNIPSFVSNRIDLKQETILYFDQMIKDIKNEKIDGISLDKDTEFILLTMIGMVTGDIANISMSENHETNTNNTSDTFLKILSYGKNSLLKSCEDKKENPTISNNSGTIIIKNAKLLPYGSSKWQSFQVLFLFSDQISGYSFGTTQF